LSAGNRELLRVIAEKSPSSLDELARITGKAKSNLSRTLRTMEGYGLVRLKRDERGRITPKIMHDRVELELPHAPCKPSQPSTGIPRPKPALLVSLIAAATSRESCS
jgi:predicted transcriptional regulator